MKSRQKILSSILKNKDLSEFEKRVYKAILKVPAGRTRSYKWVARTIGRPKAYRAVGNALGKNPYPVIIPCHRIVKSDGSIGGYSKGTAPKKRLLKREGVAKD